ncbi:hypothetical protein D3C80_1352090 [compost metagenome]
MLPIARDQLAEGLQIERFTQVTEEGQPQAMDHRYRGLTQDRLQLTAQHHCAHLAAAAGMTQKAQAIHTCHFQVTESNIHRVVTGQHRDRFIAVRRLQNGPR